MKLAVRFRYYKPVTPSLHLVELPFDEWRKFLGMEKPQERFDYMIKFLNEERMRGYIKEMFWIPLEDNMELKVHRRKKEPKAKPIQPTEEQIEQYRKDYNDAIVRINGDESIGPPLPEEQLKSYFNRLSENTIICNLQNGVPADHIAYLELLYD